MMRFLPDATHFEMSLFRTVLRSLHGWQPFTRTGRHLDRYSSAMRATHHGDANVNQITSSLSPGPYYRRCKWRLERRMLDVVDFDSRAVWY
jgi:hypothetical protein